MQFMKHKKFLTILIVLCMILCQISNIVYADNHFWQFDSKTKTLYIISDDSNKSIDNEWYKIANEIESVIFTDGVTKIDSFVSGWVRNVKNVQIGKNVTEIGSRAFANCALLKTIIIGESVKRIEDRAFDKCTSLEAIYIPDSVTYIGDFAFRNCKNLKQVTGCNNVIEPKANVFILAGISRENVNSFKNINDEDEISKEYRKILAVVDGAQSDEEKLYRILHYMKKNYVYDHNYGSASVHTLLLYKTSVCNGYAWLMYELGNDIGIETHYISSASLSHAWNVVKIRNKYYYIDFTNDEFLMSGKKYLSSRASIDSHCAQYDCSSEIYDDFADSNLFFADNLMYKVIGIDYGSTPQLHLAVLNMETSEQRDVTINNVNVSNSKYYNGKIYFTKVDTKVGNISVCNTSKTFENMQPVKNIEIEKTQYNVTTSFSVDKNRLYLIYNYKDVSKKELISDDEAIKVIVNDKKLNIEQDPLIINGRTLAPLRAIFEALDATVKWDGATQTITSVKGDKTVSMTIGKNEMYKNGEMIWLDEAPQIVGERTLVPVRAIAEALDCSVDWNGETNSVIIKN